MKPNMKINRKLLPIKGHYFLFNAGTAPLVPYLSTYARQLGFSSSTVGLIYTVLPIFGLIAKPLFGVIADRFKTQKSIFILFQIVTIVSFSAIYLIPESGTTTTVELDCDSSSSYIRGCYQDEGLIDQCKVNRLSDQGGIAECNMDCDMTPKMWQTICEHWQLPEYCFGATDSLQYSARVAGVSLQDKCAIIPAENVTLDGHIYTPHCRIGGGYVDIDEPCTLKCDNQKLSGVIGNHTANMTCVNKTMNYRLCVDDTAPLTLLPKNITSECNASCDLDTSKPWRLMEICDGWDADEAGTCAPKTKTGQPLPTHLSFTGHVSLASTISEHKCVHIALKNITLPDEWRTIFTIARRFVQYVPVKSARGLLRKIERGAESLLRHSDKPSVYPNSNGSVHHSNCKNHQLFKASCKMHCNNALLNELFQTATDSRADETTQYTKQFHMFFALMIISWIGQAVVVTFADAICFNLLGNKGSHYGKQRLWGSLGWGIFSLLTGVLIDLFSESEYKNYAVAFVLMFVFMTGDVIVSCFINDESTKMSVSILAEVGTLVSSLPTLIFLLWTIAVGLCTGLLWQFLFWHLEDIAKLRCDGTDYIKTLQGLVSAIQTFCGEIPFMFLSGYILKRVGHINMMSLVLFAFGVRFILYSLLTTNPWWALPIEMLQGITFGMFYPTMASYAKAVSPPGTETTVQGLVGAVFEGVGTSLGSFIGGVLYETHGGANTFKWFGIGALVFCVLHIAAGCLLKDRDGPMGLTQVGYTSIIRYEQPGDMVCIMEDPADGKELQLRVSH